MVGRKAGYKQEECASDLSFHRITTGVPNLWVAKPFRAACNRGCHGTLTTLKTLLAFKNTKPFQEVENH